jgi:membrane-bound serine protease (ClpP class)
MACVLAVVLGVLLAVGPAMAQDVREIYSLAVDGAISSATADFIDRGIESAGKQGAHAVLILLNTPGGDINATLDIMETLENAQVPVIVYVWPRGGMAASAGALITLAASGAAMAPHTTIGAAHPVTAGDVEIDAEAMEKIVNVLVEHAGVLPRAVARRRWNGPNEPSARAKRRMSRRRWTWA